MKASPAKKIAFGGIFAGLSVILMSLSGVIPLATYVGPMLCIIAGKAVLSFCGKRIAWAWYVAVSILSMLLCPDKEAAFVYLFLGYYPMIKGLFGKTVLGKLGKLLYFNLSVVLLYLGLIYVMGMDAILTEFMSLGIWGLVVMIVLANVTFGLLDILLDRFSLIVQRGKHG